VATPSGALDAVTIELGASSQIGLTVVLMVIMFAVALALKVEHFRFLRTEPKRFWVGVGAQLIGLPLLTLGLAFLLQPPPSVALGMIVVACCPGGNVSNLLTHVAKGETALSVSLTATSSVAAAVATPVSIVFWSGLYPPTSTLLRDIQLDTLPFVVQLILILAVPLAAGMAVAEKAPRIAARIRPWLIGFGLAVIAALILNGMITYWDVVIGVGLQVVPVVILHNALAFGLGAGLALAAGLPGPAARAITFETGIQNAGLGLLILLSQFDGLGGAAVVTSFWSIWHLFAGAMLAGAIRFFLARRALKLSPGK